MNTQPGYLVSVIIAFLNEKRFLSEAVESVIKQDYDNWELILVDDGSSDGSTEIAKKFVAEFPGKIIFTEHSNHSNKGVSASRNQGISVAKGDLVAILDADDVWLPSKLRLQVELMHANPDAVMICEASEYWYTWNTNAFGRGDEIIQVGSVHDKIFYPPALAESLYPLSSGAAPCPSGIIVKKSALDRHSGFEGDFTGKNQMYEDQAFLAKFYLNEPVYISSLCNNRYRQRLGSLVQKVNQEGDYLLVRKYFLDWLQAYLKQKNLRFKKVDQLLERAFEPFNSPVIYFLRKLLQRIRARLKKLTGR